MGKRARERPVIRVRAKTVRGCRASAAASATSLNRLGYLAGYVLCCNIVYCGWKYTILHKIVQGLCHSLFFVYVSNRLCKK